MEHTLIAGFGNVLRGDDGFGVEVIRRLQLGEALGDGVRVMEVGTGGLALAQELLTPYDRLIIVDAMTRGGAPGSLYVLEVDSVESATEVDMHLAIPARALAVAKAIGGLPARVFLVGCEPAETEELTTELSAPVSGALDSAIGHVRTLVRSASTAQGRPAMNDTLGRRRAPLRSDRR